MLALTLFHDFYIPELGQCVSFYIRYFDPITQKTIIIIVILTHNPEIPTIGCEIEDTLDLPYKIQENEIDDFTISLIKGRLYQWKNDPTNYGFYTFVQNLQIVPDLNRFRVPHLIRDKFMVPLMDALSKIKNKEISDYVRVNLNIASESKQ